MGAVWHYIVSVYNYCTLVCYTAGGTFCTFHHVCCLGTVDTNQCRSPHWRKKTSLLGSFLNALSVRVQVSGNSSWQSKWRQKAQLVEYNAAKRKAARQTDWTISKQTGRWQQSRLSGTGRNVALTALAAKQRGRSWKEWLKTGPSCMFCLLQGFLKEHELGRLEYGSGEEGVNQSRLAGSGNRERVYTCF